MGKRYYRQDLKESFADYRKRVCKTCQNKMYCLINNDEDSNEKANLIHKGKGKVSCENFRPRYMGRSVEL